MTSAKQSRETNKAAHRQQPCQALPNCHSRLTRTTTKESENDRRVRRNKRMESHARPPDERRAPAELSVPNGVPNTVKQYNTQRARRQAQEAPRRRAAPNSKDPRHGTRKPQDTATHKGGTANAIHTYKKHTKKPDGDRVTRPRAKTAFV